MTNVTYPYWAWLIFFATMVVALVVDLGIANRRAHAPTRRETFIWSGVWISLALLFNAFVYWMVSTYHGLAMGILKAKEFFTGYLIELSLSIDNLFVFLLIFNFFKVPKEYQHRVLFWGIMGALGLRMIMIFAGAELVEQFHWIIYIFGAFLLYTGLMMFKNEDDFFEPHESAIVRMATKYIRITQHYDGSKFFTVHNGVKSGTLLLLVLIVIEFTDLIFAVDSIPAIFGITTDRFIVYTSNIFAILGLRTFFFLLADLANRFYLLKFGLAFILSFIGIKMLLPLIAQGFVMVMGTQSDTGFVQFLHRYINHEFNHMVVNISLWVVLGTLVLSILLSWVFPKPNKETAGKE